MKAELQLESTPVTGFTIFKLLVVGALVLGCVYGVLMVFSNAMRVLE